MVDLALSRNLFIRVTGWDRGGSLISSLSASHHVNRDYPTRGRSLTEVRVPRWPNRRNLVSANMPKTSKKTTKTTKKKEKDDLKGRGNAPAFQWGSQQAREEAEKIAADMTRAREEADKAASAELERRRRDLPSTSTGRTKAGPASFKRSLEMNRQPSPEINVLDGSDTETEDTRTREKTAEAVPANEHSESDADMLDEEEDEEPRERRGRPPTVGKYLMMRQRLAASREVKLLKKEARSLKEILDRRILPNLRDRKNIIPEREVARKMEPMTPAQISAEMTAHTDVVSKVAERSKNFQGVMVHRLHKAATMIRAGTRVLAVKATNPEEGESPAVVEGLWSRIKELEDQVLQLKFLLMQKTQSEGAASTRKRKIQRMESSDEEERAARPGAPQLGVEQMDTQADERAAEGLAPHTVAFRPVLRGEKKGIEGPTESRALEDVRRVLKGVSVEKILTGDAKTIRENIGNLVTRCEGALAIFPPTGEKTAAAKQTKAAANNQGKGAAKKSEPKGQANKNAQPSKTKTPTTAKATGSVQKLQDKAGGEVRPTKAKSQSQPLAGRSREGTRENATQRSRSRSKSQGAWVEVVKRGLRKKDDAGPKGTAPKGNVTAPEKRKEPKKTGGQRNPRTQAVTLTCPPGTYAEGMRLIKSQINLEELGIDALKPRRAQTGAIILEIAGENAKEKADALAGKMRTVIGDREGVKVTRPAKMAEIRIRDLDDSVTVTDVTEAIAEAGGCAPSEVRTGEVKPAPNGLGTIWVQCPLAAAKKAAAAGRIKIGWVKARLELLESRPLICFRCLERGHVRAQCRGKDRSEVCCRCGETGHKAQTCRAEPKCPACTERGLPANHKAGNKACPLPSKKAIKKRRREEGGQLATSQTPRSQAGGQPTNSDAMEVDAPTAERRTTAPLEKRQSRAGTSQQLEGEGQEEASAASPSCP
ncbi:PREDICTED: uncharacterized protein LOC105555652 [Vollenhovia emeryi]|uniref:uncharacterized protein LOC105555652 n=1 Tax=Vollenhovia emeryi TaxID=411798 RepID=UPI0005F376EA|nr:PREDICTED: uncharacterized protein LOC105555652 [Vollenhovia emeryi]